jgi:hypothetical protein
MISSNGQQVKNLLLHHLDKTQYKHMKRKLYGTYVYGLVDGSAKRIYGVVGCKVV